MPTSALGMRTTRTPKINFEYEPREVRATRRSSFQGFRFLGHDDQGLNAPGYYRPPLPGLRSGRWTAAGRILSMNVETSRTPQKSILSMNPAELNATNSPH